MAEALCENFISCLWQFQTLVAGILAICAAILTAIGLYVSAHVPVKEERARLKEEYRKRVRFQTLKLLQDIELIRKRARQGQGTVKAHKAASASVTDTVRQRMMLAITPTLMNWEFLSSIDEHIAQKCLCLRALIEDHNFDMERAGGAFGDDNFGDLIVRRLDSIKELIGEISSSLPTKLGNGGAAGDI